MNGKKWAMSIAAASLVLTLAGSALAETAGGEGTVVPIFRVNDTVSVEGTVQYNDLEGGFYTVDGWGLIGDAQLFSAMRDKQVMVTGKEFTGVSTRMVKQLEVSFMGYEVAAAHSLPAKVTVAGKPVAFDQQPVVENGVLMLPLRFLVEAAGGKVEWVEATQTVNVTLADRKASFVIGEAKAELNENGHQYLVRNMLPMAAAPVVRGDRTLISADAVTKILGLVEQADLDSNLDLVVPAR